MITCPSSYALWENTLDWAVGPSSATDLVTASPLPEQDATERLPVAEAPSDLHGLHWPPKHTTIKQGTHCLAIKHNLLSTRKRTWVFVPAGHPEENLRGSYLSAACQDDDCAESLGSQSRCPEQETERAEPLMEIVLPLCDNTAAVAPKQILLLSKRSTRGPLANCYSVTLFCITVVQRFPAAYPRKGLKTT